MQHLLRDLETLKKELLTIGALVESALLKASATIVEARPDLAQKVIDGDNEIDLREVELESGCLKVLALHQPVAADLRFVVTMLKVNNDLERMGDLAVNIAERSLQILSSGAERPPHDFRQLATKVNEMVTGSLDALVNQDASLARKVIDSDDEVDRLHRANFDKLQAFMIRNPGSIPEAVGSLSISRNLERVADLATNIAEDIVFMIEGEIFRHRKLRA